MPSGNPPRSPFRLNPTLLPALVALAAILALFELTGLDLRVQDRFFDAASGRWRVGMDEQPWNALFYTGPKHVLTGIGVLALVVAVTPSRWSWRRRIDRAVSRADLAVLVLTLAATPALIGGLKSATNVFCPFEIRRYGGDVPYVKVLDTYPPGDRPARRGRGFPAGHPSGGFALVALAGLARTRRGQMLGVAAGIVVGGSMGVYQIVRGAHYLSHTVVTALVAWIVFVTWRRVFQRRDPANGSGGDRFAGVTERRGQPPRRDRAVGCGVVSQRRRGFRAFFARPARDRATTPETTRGFECVWQVAR